MKKDLAKVSVIIVNYNSSKYVVKLLESLTPIIQSFCSVIVVDNCSADDSVTVIKKYLDEGYPTSNIKFITSMVNGGFSYGNNLAIKDILSNANIPDFIYLLNPDTDVTQLNCIETLVNFMLQHPEVGITGSRLLAEDHSVQCSAFRFPSIISEFASALRLSFIDSLIEKWRVVPKNIPNEASNVDWVAGASMLIRRDVIEDIGLMDEGYFLYFEETDFCLQARRKGWQCWYIPDSEVIHYVGQSTGVISGDKRRTSRPKYWFESRQRYFIKNHGFLYTVFADMAWGVGFAIWRLRRWIQQKPDSDPAGMLKDFWRNSIFLSWIK